MEWTTILVTLIGSILAGGIVSLFTIRESKKNMQLDNEGKEIENKDKEQEIHLKLIDELQDQIDKLNERLDKKDALIEEKSDTIAVLRQKLDETNTALAKAILLKCSRLACKDRIPPLGYSELTPEEVIRFNKEQIEE